MFGQDYGAVGLSSAGARISHQPISNLLSHVSNQGARSAGPLV